MKKAASSEAHLADVILMKNAVLQVSSLKGEVVIGSKRGWVRDLRTRRKSQEGALGMGLGWVQPPRGTS